MYVSFYLSSKLKNSQDCSSTSYRPFHPYCARVGSIVLIFPGAKPSLLHLLETQSETFLARRSRPQNNTRRLSPSHQQHNKLTFRSTLLTPPPLSATKQQPSSLSSLTIALSLAFNLRGAPAVLFDFAARRAEFDCADADWK